LRISKATRRLLLRSLGLREPRLKKSLGMTQTTMKRRRMKRRRMKRKRMKRRRRRMRMNLNWRDTVMQNSTQMTTRHSKSFGNVYGLKPPSNLRRIVVQVE
jgi:hypothetical protein